MSEALTGRAWSFELYPLSAGEIQPLYNSVEMDSKIEELMVFGSYPEVFTTVNHRQKQELLEEIGRSYLYKDMLELVAVKHSSKLKDLLGLLAFQIGSEVSINELSNSLNISRASVERYIDLPEKTFVLFRLKGLSRNLRKEVGKMDKIFFCDVGICNVIIENFKPLKDRNDTEQIWENFLISERIKKLSNEMEAASSYFWRTNTVAEIDYVEERGGSLFGYELKYGKTKSRVPRTWLESYAGAGYEVVSRENYLNFVGNN